MPDASRRLWVVTECYPRPFSPGHCAFAHRQLAGVRADGWEVHVLVPNGWYPPLLWRAAPAWRDAHARHVPRGWSLDGVRVSDLRFANRVPSRLNRPLDAGARVLEGLLRRLRAAGARPGRDVLMGQFALPYGPVVAAAARELGLPYAIQLRGDDVWVWPNQSEARRAAFADAVGGAGMVVAVARALLDEAERLCERPLRRAAVVPNGIDLERFAPAPDAEQRAALRESLGVAADEIAIVSVGDAIARKGWRELLDALGSLGRDGSRRLVLLAAVAGRDADLDLTAEAARRAPNVRLRLATDVRGSALGELFRAADIFALPSHWEGVSNALLEAMASGLPVVTTNVAGHPEAVTDGEEGFLVPPRESEPLGAALARLCDSPGLRRRCGDAARARAVSIGDSASTGRRLSRLLDDLMHGAATPPELLDVNPYARTRVAAGVA